MPNNTNKQSKRGSVGHQSPGQSQDRNEAAKVWGTLLVVSAVANEVKLSVRPQASKAPSRTHLHVCCWMYACAAYSQPPRTDL